MKMIKFFAYVCLLFTILYIGACRKMDEYKQYTQGGPVRYTGRVDSIIVHPGNKRVKLTMILGSDPSVAMVKAYWDNDSDSAEMHIARKSTGKDTISMIINNLQEKIYNFSVYTYDDKGNSSVVTYAPGTVYGDAYLSTLTNRELTSITQSADSGTVMLTWLAANKGEVGTELKYTDSTGNEQKILMPPSEMVTHLTGYKKNSPLLYKSLYLPDSAAIDTFSVEYSSVELSTDLPVF